jgi:hypothetical protein
VNPSAQVRPRQSVLMSLAAGLAAVSSTRFRAWRALTAARSLAPWVVVTVSKQAGTGFAKRA